MNKPTENWIVRLSENITQGLHKLALRAIRIFLPVALGGQAGLVAWAFAKELSTWLAAIVLIAVWPTVTWLAYYIIFYRDERQHIENEEVRSAMLSEKISNRESK